MRSSLTKPALAYLASLTYRVDAKRRVCILPLGSIYWEDEIPELIALMKLAEGDRNQILRLFAIRLKLWNQEATTQEDRQFWDAAEREVPSCPLFKRLSLSPEDQRARHKIEDSCAREMEEFLSGADEVTLSEDQNGFQTFSATFDLTKDPITTDKKQKWWRQLFSSRKKWN